LRKSTVIPDDEVVVLSEDAGRSSTQLTLNVPGEKNATSCGIIDSSNRKTPWVIKFPFPSIMEERKSQIAGAHKARESSSSDVIVMDEQKTSENKLTTEVVD